MLYEEYPDPETGELPSFPTINCETGEFELTGNFIQKTLLGKPFKIPKEVVIGSDDTAAFESLIKSQKMIKPQTAKPEVNNNITDDNNINKKDLPPVFLIGHLLTYLTSVLKVFIDYCIQHKSAVINNLIASDVHYQSMFKKFFRDVVPFLKIEATKVGMRQLKRKGGFFRCGLHYVKRVKIA